MNRHTKLLFNRTVLLCIMEAVGESALADKGLKFDKAAADFTRWDIIHFKGRKPRRVHAVAHAMGQNFGVAGGVAASAQLFADFAGFHCGTGY